MRKHMYQMASSKIGYNVTDLVDQTHKYIPEEGSRDHKRLQAYKDNLVGMTEHDNVFVALHNSTQRHETQKDA
eukprot:1945947-Karenia_brevis.AAC.1